MIYIKIISIFYIIHYTTVLKYCGVIEYYYDIQEYLNYIEKMDEYYLYLRLHLFSFQTPKNDHWLFRDTLVSRFYILMVIRRKRKWNFVSF